MISSVVSNFTTRNYYLQGNNSVARQQEESFNADTTTKTLLLVTALQGAASGLRKASNWFGNKLMQGEEFAPSEDVKRIAQNMVKDNKLNVNVHYIDQHNINNFGENLRGALEPVARGENAFYQDGLKIAVAPKSKPSLILHELGHAINANKGKFLRFLQKSRGYAAMAPTALLALSSLLPKKDDKRNFVERNAGKLGFAAFLPTIIEEGMASLRGLKAAKKLGKTANLKCLKRNYFFAWMTYVIAGLGLGVTSKLAFIENKK